MKATEILGYTPINSTSADHVAEIKGSILQNGWQGAPILVSQAHAMLITGSHRLAALEYIASTDYDFDLDDLGDVAEDVDDILDAWCEENDASIDEIPFDYLRAVFGGTWVEDYYSQAEEW